MRHRRRTLLISLSVHLVGLLILVGYSVWRVDELWSRHVPVTVYSPSQLPKGVVEPLPAMSLPLPANTDELGHR